MARTVNPEEFALKRQEILDAAQRLVLTKGYAQMSIQDIQNELKISSGAFHHYFNSRSALLEGLIEKFQGNLQQVLRPIVHDPHLTAIDKLQRFFDTLDQLRVEQKSIVVDLIRMWYADDNAVVRQKVDELVVEQRAPLLTEIVRQGIDEGVFTTDFPDQSGKIILALLQGMSNTHAKLLLSLGNANGDETATNIIATHAAFMDAVERVLGAHAGSLKRIDSEIVKMWVSALQEKA